MSADLPSPESAAGAHGSARWKCNACGKTVTRRLGWKLWTKSYCEATGRDARLYRVSAPNVSSSAAAPGGKDADVR